MMRAMGPHCYNCSYAPTPRLGQTCATSSSSSSSSSKPNSPTTVKGAWTDTRRGSKGDRLYDLGRSDQNTRITSGQNSRNLDILFTGSFLGMDSDIADGSLRKNDSFNSFSYLDGDYYIPPRFLETVKLFVVKNYLASTVLKGKVKIPLILGIWGGKGCGKTFITQLCLKRMGVEAVIMSAGELEDEVAGKPGRYIRERYREASELQKGHGKLTALLINDIDAGLGRFENTQATVNNQMVVGTMMNLCDHPEQVASTKSGSSFKQSTSKEQYRVPIIVTGNDLSTVYAPLIRDGRMQKFLWEPSRDDTLGILKAMFKDDGLSDEQVEYLLDTFPGQTLDFFGAARSSAYDKHILKWIDVESSESDDDAHDMEWLSKRLIEKEDLPNFRDLHLTFTDFMTEACRLATEQQLVMDTNLAAEYMGYAK